MRCPTMRDLPKADAGLVGWPWDQATPELPDAMPDGQPWPRITIVTPSFNQAEFLEETIRSVLLQGYPDIEYMVVDGGSHDGSVEIIEKYGRWLTWWVSEPDGGQVDAINKGLARSTGAIFNWINSDDLLNPGALGEIVAGFDAATDAVAGACLVFGEGHTPLVQSNLRLKPELLIQGAAGARLQQPALWLRPSYVHSCGGLDAAFHFFFDVELAIRYLAMFPRVRYTDAVLARFRFHPESKSVAMLKEFHREYARALEKTRDAAGSESLRRHAARRLEELALHRELAPLLGDTARPRWRRVISLVGMAVRSPRPRLLKISAAGLRRLVLGRPWTVGTGD